MLIEKHEKRVSNNLDVENYCREQFAITMLPIQLILVTDVFKQVT